jgi:stress response protein YsnF
MSHSNTPRIGVPLMDMILATNKGYLDLMMRASKTWLDISRVMLESRTVTESVVRPFDVTRRLFDLMAETSVAVIALVPDVTKQFNGNEQVVAIGEEVLDVGVRKVVGETTRVRRIVKDVPVERSVELHDETIVIERRPVSQPGNAEALTEREFVMIDTREIPVVSKHTNVREELVLRKEVSGRVEIVRETLRSADVDIVQPQRMPAVMPQRSDEHDRRRDTKSQQNS